MSEQYMVRLHLICLLTRTADRVQESCLLTILANRVQHSFLLTKQLNEVDKVEYRPEQLTAYRTALC